MVTEPRARAAEVAPAAAHQLDAALHLLDRQVVDADGRLVAKVDDLLLRRSADGSLEVEAILVGPAALARRLPRRVGGLVAAVHGRLAGTDRPASIDWSHVDQVRSAVTLDVPAEEVYRPGFEGWARRRVVGRIPGAEHDPDS